MSTFLPAEKGTTIRMPSTANLMLDSADRDAIYTRANAFQITRPNAILNGFFTRIGTTEVVLEYSTPNISAAFANNTLTIDISGTGAPVTYTANGFFNAAELSDWVAAKLNAKGGTWTIAAAPPSTGLGAGAIISPAANTYVTFTGPIADALAISGSELYVGPTADASGVLISSVFVDLRPFRYLDFTSAQLTYNQDLKDSSTAPYPRDVLCRWYMAWDEAPAYDAYGFPILMGYAPFQLRRTFSPPKQIRWDNIQSLGNIAFEVWDNTNRLAPFNFNTNWLMTLQVSEV
jgi:hypothetical protein